MRIGIIGAGGIASAFAKQALSAGHEVILSNSRGPESLAGLVAGLRGGASAGTVAEAAREAIVFVAVEQNTVRINRIATLGR